ncbi:anhydro-N-acetylmuramic acid kinase [Algoriphagus marinus]|uniref:anhydro-N-acetylmuramic acid kinase n=1 Tax=Algoriphagus marinus TaxID=1925762 RepID=UPI00094B7ED0|nr:anhydro-N-acetylmuramic acid kinase [Algoriphagus marinus]
MNHSSYTVIGLMSGTSGDGLDLALCEFNKDSSWSFQILEAETSPFPKTLELDLMRSHTLSGLELSILDVRFGNWMGEQVNQFCKKYRCKPDAICSHGHTVYHQPEKGLSLQIGNGWALYQQTGIKVINDFRMLDVQLGGQGAPLVPIGDELLFPEMDFCINLGGIANISMNWEGKRIAFDTCPFNLLLNPQAKILGADYDDQGKWASEGKVDQNLLKGLNSISFYKKNSAKSLGREDLEKDFLPLISASQASEKDILATLIDHYAFQISTVIKDFSSNANPKVLLTGGGAYNEFFIQSLENHLNAAITILKTAPQLIEFKEALIFGFLGVLRLRGEINCLSSVTGADRDSSGGMIFG